VSEGRARLVLLGLAAAWLGACGGFDSCGGGVPVRKVLVDVEPVAASAGVDREGVRRVVAEVLAAGGAFHTVSESDSGAVLRVTVVDLRADPGERKSALRVSVEATGLPPSEGAEGGRAALRGVGTGVDVLGTAPDILVRAALGEALRQIEATRGAARTDSRALVAWLDDPNASSEQKRRAIGVLGARQERSAVEALGRVLRRDGDDEALARPALAALAQIGDPTAADAVIAYADGKPPHVVAQAVEAVRAMGGARARAWLFVVSTGHPDAEVQRRAQAALAAVEGDEPGPAMAERRSTDAPAAATP
jgi:hypothetical protein